MRKKNTLPVHCPECSAAGLPAIPARECAHARRARLDSARRERARARKYERERGRRGTTCAPAIRPDPLRAILDTCAAPCKFRATDSGAYCETHAEHVDGPPVDGRCETAGAAVTAYATQSRDARSWRPEVLISGEWSANALRFATAAEAHASASELLRRWYAPEAGRAAPSPDAPSHRFDFVRQIAEALR